MIITTTKEMRPRDVADLYPTPLTTCYASLALLPPIQPLHILDPGAGAGPWGLAAARRWGFAHIHGIELRDVAKPTGYSTWTQGSFIVLPTPKPPKPTGNVAKDARAQEQYRFDLWASQQPVWANHRTFDLVVGNPPYKWAEAFVRHSLAVVNDGGYVCFLLRLAFLEGQDRGTGLWQEHPVKHVAVCSKRPSFTGDSKTDSTAYAIFIWAKGYKGSTNLTWLSEAGI